MIFLLSCTFALFFSGYAANNSSDLPQAITKFEALSRVTNGIYLRSAVSNGETIVATLELLKINWADSLTFIESLDTSPVAGQFDSIQKSVSTVQVRNASSLRAEFSLLDSMRESHESLSRALKENPCEKWIAHRKNINIGGRTNFTPTYSQVPLIVPALDTVMAADTSKQFGIDDAKLLGDALLTIQDEYRVGALFFGSHSWNDSQKIYMMGFTNGPNDGVREMMNVAKIVEEYMKNFAKLTVLMTELTKLSADVKSVLPIVKESRRMDELSGALKNISESVELMMEPMGPLELTVGLPEGTADLEQIFKDLDDDWMKKTIADGKDLKKLKKLLEPLNKFTDGVKKVEVSWKNVSGHPGIHKALGLSTDLKTAADNGKTAGDTDPSDAIQAYSTCLTSLQPVTSNPNFAHFKIFHDTVMEVERQITTAIPLLKKLSEGKVTGSKTFPHSSDQIIHQILRNAHKNMPLQDVTAAVEAIQKEEEIHVAHAALKEYLVLAPYNEVFNLFQKTQKNERYGDDIHTALKESNLLATVDCLQKTELKIEKVEAFLKLGDTADIITKRLSDTKDVLEFLKSLMVMKKTWKEVSGAEKKTVRRRKRTSGGLEDLKNSKQLSIDLGRGVMALKKIEEVRKHKKTVLEVADCGDKVDNLIRTLPQVSALWTTDNKNGLSDMIKEVNDLDKKCSSLHPHDLLNLSTVFDLAADIRGVPIPSQLFSDPIAASLRTSSDPDLLKTADAFQSVSTLQLDFANQLSDLRAASGTLSSLGTFFDNFFGIVRMKSPKKSQKPTATGFPASTASLPSGNTVIFIVIPIILLLLIALGFGVWYYFQRNDPLFWKRLFMNKKKFAELIILNSRYLDFQEENFMKKHPKLKVITEAVEPNELETISMLVKQGFWINSEKESDTLLHLATCYGKVEIAELLITNGADRTALNYMYKTPEDMVTVALNTLQEKSNKNDEDRERIKNIEKIRDLFVAMKDETFLRKIPPLLKPKQFLIFISDNCDRVKFEKSYGNQITAELKVATHIVVKTDKDGIYEPDDNHVENMFRIFSRSMLMKECWLGESLKKKSNMQDDYKFQVEKIRFKGQVYSSIKDWHRSFHMKKVPYLTRVQAVCMSKPDWKLTALLKRLGADVHEQIPELKTFNHKTAHPYHLFKHKLMWALYPDDEKTWFRDQSDYLLLSLEELFVILLKREFEYDPKMEPMAEVMIQEGEEDAKG